MQANPQYAVPLGNYALFLSNIRKDYDRAEEYFQRALQADPEHANALGGYADFLHEIRKDYDLAEKNYERALQSDPQDANILGNYTGFLLALGRSTEGLERLERLLISGDFPSWPSLEVECWFYAYAHRVETEGREEALRQLMRVVRRGDRSPEWDFSDNIAQAAKEGHQNVALLEALDAVITKDADIATLDAFSLGL